MKVLVCGGRDYNNENKLFKTLDYYHLEFKFTHLIHGGAKGADHLAYKWASSRGIVAIGYLAQWNTYGKNAGQIRNSLMLEHGKPDLVIAFPTGGPGTRDMIAKAQAAKVRVIEI